MTDHYRVDADPAVVEMLLTLFEIVDGDSLALTVRDRLNEADLYVVSGRVLRDLDPGDEVYVGDDVIRDALKAVQK